MNYFDRLNKRFMEARTGKAEGKLENSTRQKVNADLIKAGLDGNGRFDNVAQAMNVAWAQISKVGIEPGDHPSVGSGDSGRFSQGLRWSNEADIFSPTDIPNSEFYVTWTKLGENKYEVVAYLS